VKWPATEFCLTSLKRKDLSQIRTWKSLISSSINTTELLQRTRFDLVFLHLWILKMVIPWLLNEGLLLHHINSYFRPGSECPCPGSAFPTDHKHNTIANSCPTWSLFLPVQLLITHYLHFSHYYPAERNNNCLSAIRTNLPAAKQKRQQYGQLFYFHSSSAVNSGKRHGTCCQSWSGYADKFLVIQPTSLSCLLDNELGEICIKSGQPLSAVFWCQLELLSKSRIATHKTTDVANTKGKIYNSIPKPITNTC
jgi:hypothetical protein